MRNSKRLKPTAALLKKYARVDLLERLEQKEELVAATLAEREQQERLLNEAKTNP